MLIAVWASMIASKFKRPSALYCQILGDAMSAETEDMQHSIFYGAPTRVSKVS